jgi:hypothetical protein
VNFTPVREALNKNTSSERLRELFFQNRDRNINIDRAIAQNPNTPVDVLICLSYSYAIEVINNPSLPLPSQQSELLQSISLTVLRFLIKNPQTPVSFLEWVLNNYSNDLIERQSWQLPNWFLKYIARNFPIECINHALTSRIYFHYLKNHDLPEYILELLANISLNKNIIGIGRLLAKDSYTSSYILERLAQSKDYKLRYLIAQHANTSSMTLTKIAAESNQMTPQEKISEYIRLPLLQFVLKHSNCPDSVLEILAQDLNNIVRKWIARSAKNV